MARSFFTYDVFTKKPFTGNALAIITNGEGLDDDAMQKIAREFNLSETVFIFPPENPAHSAKVRIFTPGKELPFAGHPTVGTAIHLAKEKLGSVTKEEDAIIVLEQQIGPVRVGVRLRPDEAAFAEFDVPQQAKEVCPAKPKDLIATALDLAPEDIGFENHVPTVYTAGNAFTFVPVHDREAISRAKITGHHWDEAFPPDEGPAAFLYTREVVNHNAAFHARMYWPAIGVGEDPATGSAVAAFPGPILRFDDLRDGPYTGIIEQGYEMGRPSQITLEIAVKGGALEGSRIGGYAVPITRGELEA